MPERYIEAILKYLSEQTRSKQPVQPMQVKQLARAIGVGEEDYGTFREAVKQLRQEGRVVLGERNAVTLPEMGKRVIGMFRANPRGFGFVIPEVPNAHGDLFISQGSGGGALTGDRVVAAVSRGMRAGQMAYQGRIVQILERGQNKFVGELQSSDGMWFVLPDGNQFTRPIIIRDVGAAAPPKGSKVVVEIVEYGKEGQLPAGVIVEALGAAGPLEVETLAVMRAHGLDEKYPEAVVAEARAAAAAFNHADHSYRENLTGWTIVTIDPPDARDFDDAISLARNAKGQWELGVHIADVSHFVREGTALDAEAYRRSTSSYFPRKVVPMLPEVLSNGVCSLQEGQVRYCKSAMMTYDSQGEVVRERVCESVISSAKRLTYQQAQDICDGKIGGYEPRVVEVVQSMEKLARLIEARRRRDGMIELELPSVELVFDDKQRVIDAVPEDNAYSHTVIEMMMVEANETVARLFDRLNRPVLRRIHPEPDSTDSKQLASFVRAAGHKIPRDLSRQDIQKLLEGVRGTPASYAVNLAVLRMMEQAQYSPRRVGHYALASNAYCHFTSPIRRYPDLTVHRMVEAYCRGKLETRPPEDMAELIRMGEHCTAAEKRSEAAERELREVLVLQYLADHVGDEFEGVITGVTNFGVFVQSRRFLAEGLLRMNDLGDDWWELDARIGQLRGQRTGRTFRIGDALGVRIAAVDVARRQLNLALIESLVKPGQQTKPGQSGQSKPGQAKQQQGRQPGQAQGQPQPKGQHKAQPAGQQHKNRHKGKGHSKGQSQAQAQASRKPGKKR